MELRKQSILIVDDVPSNIKILGDALKGRYYVRAALNGRDALAIASSDEPPDLILLDIVIPEMDGYEICRRLKSNDATMDIPVIFTTSKDQEDDETRGLEVGAVDYITKPFSIPIVRARVKTHLELKLQRDMLRELSMIDTLTRIPNRRRLDEMFLSEWKRAMRQNHPFSLAIIDIDHFKIYNDTYGHPAGDECLRLVASELSDVLRRSGDFVARYGGEEFVVLLPGTDLAGASSVAETMRQCVKKLEIEHENSPVCNHVTISVGVACMVPCSDNTSEGLLKAADDALYLAKNSGRDRVEV